MSTATTYPPSWHDLAHLMAHDEGGLISDAVCLAERRPSEGRPCDIESIRYRLRIVSGELETLTDRPCSCQGCSTNRYRLMWWVADLRDEERAALARLEKPRGRRQKAAG